MNSWRVLFIILLAVILIPTLYFMRKREELEERGEKQEAEAVRRKLKVCCGCLIAVFLVVLVLSMVTAYTT